MMLNCHPKKKRGKASKGKRTILHTTPRVITVSHWHINDKYTKKLSQNMEPINKVPRILIDQDADPVLLHFKRQRLGLHFEKPSTISPNHSIFPKQKTHHNQIRYLIQTQIQRCRSHQPLTSVTSSANKRHTTEFRISSSRQTLRYL